MSEYFKHESSYVDEGCIVGKGTKIWHFSHIMSGCQIGENCNIGQNVVVSPNVVLGRNCKVQNNVSIYTGVRCEDDVFLGPSMVFTNVINPRSAVSRKDEYKDTLIRRGASVGANAEVGNTVKKEWQTAIVHSEPEIVRIPAKSAKAFFTLTHGEEAAKEGEYPIFVFNPHPYTRRDFYGLSGSKDNITGCKKMQ